MADSSPIPTVPIRPPAQPTPANGIVKTVVQKDFDSGTRKVIGVNSYVAEGANPFEPFEIDPAIESEQVERLARLRRERDAVAVSRALAELDVAARDGASIIPPTIAAVKAYATVGEISQSLAGVFGSFERDAII